MVGWLIAPGGPPWAVAVRGLANEISRGGSMFLLVSDAHTSPLKRISEARGARDYPFGGARRYEEPCLGAKPPTITEGSRLIPVRFGFHGESQFCFAGLSPV